MFKYMRNIVAALFTVIIAVEILESSKVITEDSDVEDTLTEALFLVKMLKARDYIRSLSIINELETNDTDESNSTCPMDEYNSSTPMSNNINVALQTESTPPPTMTPTLTLTSTLVLSTSSSTIGFNRRMMPANDNNYGGFRRAGPDNANTSVSRLDYGELKTSAVIVGTTGSILEGFIGAGSDDANTSVSHLDYDGQETSTAVSVGTTGSVSDKQGTGEAVSVRSRATVTASKVKKKDEEKGKKSRNIRPKSGTEKSVVENQALRAVLYHLKKETKTTKQSTKKDDSMSAAIKSTIKVFLERSSRMQIPFNENNAFCHLYPHNKLCGTGL